MVEYMTDKPNEPMVSDKTKERIFLIVFYTACIVFGYWMGKIL